MQLSPNSQDPQSTGVHQILLMNTRDETLGNFFHFSTGQKASFASGELTGIPVNETICLGGGNGAPGGAGDIGVLPKIKWNASMVWWCLIGFFPKKCDVNM